MHTPPSAIRLAAKLAALVALLLVSACAAPGETWSLRGTLAGEPYVPTPLYQTAGPAALYGPAQRDPAYASDLARLQAGLPAVNVSQVTIAGGQIHVPVGGGILQRHSDWRAHGATTFTVAECEVAAVPLQRVDKGGTITLYATRVTGIVSLSPTPPAAPCTFPYTAQTYPSAGRFPLHLPTIIQHATVSIAPWGSPVPSAYAPGYGSGYGYGYAPNPYLQPHHQPRRHKR